VFLRGLLTFTKGPNIEDDRLKGTEKHAFEIFKARFPTMTEGQMPENAQLFRGLLPLLDGLRLR
jgi:hypothetical protein